MDLEGGTNPSTVSLKQGVYGVFNFACLYTVLGKLLYESKILHITT